MGKVKMSEIQVVLARGTNYAMIVAKYRKYV